MNHDSLLHAYRRTPAVQARLDAQRALISAAVQCSAAGYAGCSIAAVAGRAGVAAGTVYRHFENKGALAAEVFRVVVGVRWHAVPQRWRAESRRAGQASGPSSTPSPDAH